LTKECVALVLVFAFELLKVSGWTCGIIQEGVPVSVGNENQVARFKPLRHFAFTQDGCSGHDEMKYRATFGQGEQQPPGGREIATVVRDARHSEEVQRLAKRVLFFRVGHGGSIAESNSGVHTAWTTEQQIWPPGH
jgi:hypothetical protein